MQIFNDVLHIKLKKLFNKNILLMLITIKIDNITIIAVLYDRAFL
jgi:hypothetical protein